MSKPYSEETKELILQMHEYGLSGRAIARSLGLGKTSVNDFIAYRQQNNEAADALFSWNDVADEEDFSFINQEIYPLDWKKRVHPEGLIAGGGLADSAHLDELIFGAGKDASAYLNEFIPINSLARFDGKKENWADYFPKDTVCNTKPFTYKYASFDELIKDCQEAIDRINNPVKEKSITHLFIPDNQVKPGIDMSYLTWIGKYIARKQPDVIVCGGDFADMPSLSSYDKGTRRAEGKNVQDDIDAAIKGMETLLAPMRELQAKQRDAHQAVYSPRMVLTLGNHEDRIDRHVNANPELHKFLSIKSLRYEDFGWEVVPFLTPINIHGISYCLAPYHKVLTDDLKYVELGDLKVGDTLLAFDEEAKGTESYRKYKKSVVLKHDLDTAELFRVTLGNGKHFDVTADHLWLARKHGSSAMSWKKTSELKVGVSHVPQLFPEWEQDMSRDSGWLAGIFDGEGHLSKPNGKQGGIQLGVSQNEGIILDKIYHLLDKNGIEYKSWNGSADCQSVRVLGVSGEKLKFLGTFRPERLIKKFKPEMLGRVQKALGSKDDKVVKIESIGMGTIVKIETSTKTMIVEGYGHHNCHYFINNMTGKPLGGSALNILKTVGTSFTQGHRQTLDVAVRFLPSDGKQQWGIVAGAAYTHEEEYKGNQGNHHWRGIILKHNVKDGAYDPLFVSLDWLKSEYGK